MEITVRWHYVLIFWSPAAFCFSQPSETSQRLARYSVKQSETPTVLLEQAKIWFQEQGTTDINLLPFTLIGYSVCNKQHLLPYTVGICTVKPLFYSSKENMDDWCYTE